MLLYYNMTDTISKDIKSKDKEFIKVMRHILYEYGVSSLLIIFNTLFLIFKIREKHNIPLVVPGSEGVKKVIDEIKKTKPALDLIFFTLSILSVVGTIINVVRFVDKGDKKDIWSVILGVILAVINLFTGVLLVSQETNKIIIEIKKEILSTGVSVLNIVYYVLYTIFVALSAYEMAKRSEVFKKKV